MAAPRASPSPWKRRLCRSAARRVHHRLSVANRRGTFGLREKNGWIGRPRQLDVDSGDIFGRVATSWSTNHREVLCMARTTHRTTDLMILPADGSKMRPFL